MDFVLPFLELLARNFPAVIVLGICALTTLSQWHRHPPSARWALFTFVWFLITDLLAIAWYSFGIPLALAELPNVQDPMIIGSLILSTCEGVGYIFFLFALNAARIPYRPKRYYDDFDMNDPLPPKSSDDAITSQTPRRRTQDQDE